MHFILAPDQERPWTVLSNFIGLQSKPILDWMLQKKLI